MTELHIVYLVGGGAVLTPAGAQHFESLQSRLDDAEEKLAHLHEPDIIGARLPVCRVCRAPRRPGAEK